MEFDSLIEKISLQTGKSKEEVLDLVSNKKAKFAGLLTDIGAALVIAKELNVKVLAESDFYKVSDLKQGLKNADFKAVVFKIFPPKEFEAKGTKGIVQNIYLKDDSGIIRLTLWNKEIEKYGSSDFKKGDILKLENVRVGDYKGEPQVLLNYNSNVERIGFESPKESLLKLNELKAGLSSVSLEALLKKVFERREFAKGDRKGELIKFLISQEETEFYCIAWNEKAREIETIGEGAFVLIQGAYVKDNNGTLELHLGSNSKVQKKQQMNSQQ